MVSYAGRPAAAAAAKRGETPEKKGFKIYIHAHTRKHDTTRHKTRLDKTPRRDMRRLTHIHTRQTHTTRQAQQDKHSKTSTTRQAQQDKHSKTSTTRQAQQDKHNMTSTPLYTGGHGVSPPGVSTHGSPSQPELQLESQDQEKKLQDPSLRASTHGQCGKLMLRRGSGQDRRGTGRQTSCCRNSSSSRKSPG